MHGTATMPPATWISIALSVLLICTGQLLFKVSGAYLATGASPFTLKFLVTFGVALGIYGVATVLWIFVLKSVPLTRAYPFMALSFLIVPLASIVLFAESVRPLYFAGITLIVAGILLTVVATAPK
jgi:drug/metabolite transporter (DMT)-like permease